MTQFEARAPLAARLMCLLVTISTAALTACAPPTNETLPDDPGTEIIRNPNDGSAANPTPDDPPTPLPDPPDMSEPTPGNPTPSAGKYAHVDPKKLIPSNLKAAALDYYDRNLSEIRNKAYLSVIDYAQSSTRARFFIINMSTGAVKAIHVAHGKGSDSNHDGYAEKFSNLSGSNATSLGYYMTAETYSGSHGLSLRLDGLSSTNSNARSRAVVIHGASYVQERDVIQGRSWGCPAVTMELRTAVINMIKGGSILYAGRSTTAR
ncbi:MAG: murein L,D-transpeptidase catalytic domain family protein [Bdellovibrionota bacterium]